MGCCGPSVPLANLKIHLFNQPCYCVSNCHEDYFSSAMQLQLICQGHCVVRCMPLPRRSTTLTSLVAPFSTCLDTPSRSSSACSHRLRTHSRTEAERSWSPQHVPRPCLATLLLQCIPMTLGGLSFPQRCGFHSYV